MQEGLVAFFTLLFIVCLIISRGDIRLVLTGFFLFCLGLIIVSREKESYENIPPFFPWNEATLVHKRIPNSTNYDCSWEGSEYTFPRKETIFYDAQLKTNEKD